MARKRFNINLDESAFNRDRTPVKSLFKSSSEAGQKEATEQKAPQEPAQPLSYAHFVVQSKPRLPQSAVRAGEGSGVSCAEVSPPPGSILEPESTQSKAVGSRPDSGCAAPVEEGDERKQEEGQRSDAVQTVPASLLGSGNSIIVSPRQRGNPILKFVRSVPWEFGEVVPDYVLGRTTCALFLSLRYHNLNPNYVHGRLKQLGNSFTLRVLLVQVDVKDPHHALRELARICIMADCTLILAWSPEEAGRYLETYKSYEKKPADLLKEQVEKDYLSKVTDCLTTVKSVNKTDVLTLLSTFSSVEGIMKASKEELELCPGLGPQKARRLHDVLHQPFLKQS
ncbi:DNA excision repair protein ERCC-1 [Denticeps clupeoides]|uniref:DNA excision repair protein ERCC-1 n=1 Tax=Denticeps clupeoides TaxID=299321 RepID=A0AAY4BLI6_9TELE|nr:DNA excision repair protein ERCC-1 [Denticeps clupeoides]